MTDPLARALANAPKPMRDGMPDVPKTFVGFCVWMGVRLSEAQELVARVCYDGEDIPDTPLGRSLFGFAGSVPPSGRQVVTAVCGGRGGKSYVLIALRLLWGMLVRDLSSLAPGQQAVALVVAPNDTLRQEAVNYAYGAARSKAELRPLLVLPAGTREDDAPSTFGVKRPDFRRVVKFEGGVCTRGGYGGRGRSLTDFAMDESAFFRDSSYKVNDADIFKAASPRVLPGGQSIIGSTPWAKAGLLYENYEENYAHPKTGICVHVPTAVLNPLPHILEMVEREYKRDPENAEREFGAKFIAIGSTVFFAPELIQLCTKEYELPLMPKPGVTVRAGGDFGFRSDSSALAISHEQTDDERHIRLAELRELRPDEGRPLKPSVTVGEFLTTLREHRVEWLMADGHYRESVSEHLHELSFVPAPHAPHEAYVRARQLMREGRIELPEHYVVDGVDLADRLRRQLKQVEGRPLPGGGMQIVMPKWRAGGHGDLVSAWVLSVYQHGGEAIDVPNKEARQLSEAEREALAVERHDAAKTGEWWERKLDDEWYGDESWTNDQD